MPKPMNKEMGGKPKMSGDQMKVLGRVMKYMLKNYKFSFIIGLSIIFSAGLYEGNTYEIINIYNTVLQFTGLYASLH